MAEEEDRISWLPDLLLVEIISRILLVDKVEGREDEEEEERLMTTKEVIKTTTTISKRWQRLWTKLPNLIFLDYYDGGHGCYYDDFGRIIGNTLSQCPTDVNLHKFKLKMILSILHTSQLNTWIRYAITRNVQELDLSLWDDKLGLNDREFTFYDDLFFNNSCITRMKLFNCVFNPPNATICWDQLQFLCIRRGRLVGDLIGKILSGSPCLETLELDDCYGVSRIHATSKKFKNLVLTNYGSWYRCDKRDYIDTIEINAPYMLSLTIKKKLYLEKILLLNVSSLVKADFNYLGSHRFANSLGRDRHDIEEELLSGLLSSLAHVEEITLGDYNCLNALYHLEQRGFQFRKGSNLPGVYPNSYKVFPLYDVAAEAETKTEEKAEETGESKTEEKVENIDWWEWFSTLMSEEKVEETGESKTQENIEETEESDDALSRLGDKGFQALSRVGTDGDEDRIKQLTDGTVAAAVER